MNKNIALLAAASAFVLASSANALEFRPYAGAQYNFNHNGVVPATEEGGQHLTSNVDTNSYSVFVGTDYNRFFGTEVFYQNSNKWHKKFGDIKVKSDFAAYGLDAYGYLPLGCDRVFSLLGTAGIANYDFTTKVSHTDVKSEDNGLGYRLGLGAQYNITNHFAVRGIARYIWTDKLDGMDHMMEYSLGARYTF